MGSPLTRAWGAFAACLILAAIITWPIVVEPSSGLIGHPGNDSWNHAWGMWWVFDGIVNRGGIPFHTSLLNYPDGGSLFYIDSFNAVLTAPIQHLFGTAFAFNATVFFGVAWTAFGAWLLARHVLRDPSIAWVSAVIFGCNAHLMAQTYNGITETINAGWIPLFVLALLRLIERPSIKKGLLLGVVFAIASLANFYYGLFCILLGIVILISQTVTERGRIRWAKLMAGLTVGGMVAIAVVLPVLMTLSSTMDSPDAMVSRDPDFVWNSLLRHNYTDIIGFIRPGHSYSPDLKAEYGEDLIIVTYIGWVTLLLSTSAVLLTKRRAYLKLWIAISIIFTIFALGPYLHIGSSTPVTINGRLLPLPFLPFFEAFPLFSRISHPFRFIVPAMLGLSILAAAAVRLVTRGQSERVRGCIVSAVCVAVITEVLFASPAVWPIPRSDAQIPKTYSDMILDGAVLDLPITVPNLERGVYTYYQTTHKRPVPYGLNEPVPARLRQNRLTDFILYVESGHAETIPPMLPTLELVGGARLLYAQGYRYIVLHERFLIAPKSEIIGSVLESIIGPPRSYPSDGITVFELQF
jgi:hypothetical protein